MRVLYVWLLRLHPRRFRERFTVEMLESFDEASASGSLSGARLLADACTSLTRQWVLRPEAQVHRATATAAAPALAAGGAPAFYQFEDYRLRHVAVMNGVVCSMALFAAALLFMGAGGVVPQGWTIGSTDPRPRLLAVSRRSIVPSRPGTRVSAPVPPPTPVERFAAGYFPALLVLDRLDADGDFALSADEIEQAPVVLAELDADHNGRLTPPEMGFDLGSDAVAPAVVARAMRDFMGQNPVLRVLDADADLEVSAREIQNASKTLWQLDVSGDGRLGTVELIPDRAAWALLTGLPK